MEILPFPPAARAKLVLLSQESSVFAQLQQLRDGFGSALVLIFMIGFFWGIIKIWSGANAISKGDSEGKGGILAGIIIAAAAGIMAALFAIFGMQDAVVTPRFGP